MCVCVCGVCGVCVCVCVHIYGCGNSFKQGIVTEGILIKLACSVKSK